jgi:hypothetical protein
MTYPKSQSLVRTVLFACVAVCLLASCQDEEIVATPADVTTEVAADENGNIETNVTSLTVMGENTVFAQSVECSTCTYVVAENTDLIDGEGPGTESQEV